MTEVDRQTKAIEKQTEAIKEQTIIMKAIAIFLAKAILYKVITWKFNIKYLHEIIDDIKKSEKEG